MYNILVLGASGSGKTCFLASMYEKLSVQRPDIGFFVRIGERERIILASKYREMEDPSKAWPPSTKDVKEWRFTCCVRAGERNYPLLDFAYLDYAGQQLTQESENPAFSVDDVATKADAILILLDGLKILRRLEGISDTLSSPLHNDLRYILPIIQNLEGTPLHFVITKWDLLEGKYTLREAREVLFEDERFVAIVEQQRTRKNPTRLIPVSAVGKGFATLVDDSMKKNPNAIPKPFQVEVPIACVLIDGFEMAQRSLSARQRESLLKKKGFWQQFFQKITGASESVPPLPLPPQYQLAQSVLKALLSFVHKELTSSLEKLEREREDAIKSVQDENGAMRSLVLSYQILTWKLEKDFPESNLHRV
jgi:hypothetical protein